MDAAEMKIKTKLLLLLPFACGACRPPAQPEPKRQSEPKLSDSFAKTALVALKAIQNETRSQAQAAIDHADAEATSAPEKNFADALTGVYAAGIRLTAMIETVPQVIPARQIWPKYYPDGKEALVPPRARRQFLADQAAEARARAARGRARANITSHAKSIQTCFDQIETALRARSTIVPLACSDAALKQ
jgi:hypothetical protein